MRKLFALPTWGIAAYINPVLPNSHPWKGKHPSLNSWIRGRTDLCKFLDFFFWMQIPVFAILLWVVFR